MPSATGPTTRCCRSSSKSLARTARATAAFASSTPSTCESDDIPRFARSRVIASMQPYHCADDGRWAEKRIGAERAKGTYAFRSLLDAGAVLAFGTDWNVAPLDPLQGIAAAVTRRTLDGKHPAGWVPEQKITVAEAVRAGLHRRLRLRRIRRTGKRPIGPRHAGRLRAPIPGHLHRRIRRRSTRRKSC